MLSLKIDWIPYTVSKVSYNGVHQCTIWYKAKLDFGNFFFHYMELHNLIFLLKTQLFYEHCGVNVFQKMEKKKFSQKHWLATCNIRWTLLQNIILFMISVMLYYLSIYLLFFIFPTTRCESFLLSTWYLWTNCS